MLYASTSSLYIFGNKINIITDNEIENEFQVLNDYANLESLTFFVDIICDASTVGFS